MAVRFDGLRPDDPPGQIRVVGWGNLAQDLQNRVQVGQRLVLEGRLRISTLTRADGMKEKRAEFTLARLHPLAAAGRAPAGRPAAASSPAPAAAPAGRAGSSQAAPPPPPPGWNTAPLVPDELGEGEDEIPF
jgi:single-stranded DNA-binding protein